MLLFVGRIILCQFAFHWHPSQVLTNVLPSSKADLAIFGASMAGACVGFLLHNRYKASVFMGDTGSLALGGALAAMAACTGMFLPLFVASGIFVMEASSVIMQVLIHFKHFQPCYHSFSTSFLSYPYMSLLMSFLSFCLAKKLKFSCLNS